MPNLYKEDEDHVGLQSIVTYFLFNGNLTEINLQYIQIIFNIYIKSYNIIINEQINVIIIYKAHYPTNGGIFSIVSTTEWHIKCI